MVVGAYDLDTALPDGLAPETLVDLMGRDKKALTALTFVLDGPVGVEVVPGVPAAAVFTALDRLRDWSR